MPTLMVACAHAVACPLHRGGESLLPQGVPGEGRAAELPLWSPGTWGRHACLGTPPRLSAPSEVRLGHPRTSPRRNAADTHGDHAKGQSRFLKPVERHGDSGGSGKSDPRSTYACGGAMPAASHEMDSVFMPHRATQARPCRDPGDEPPAAPRLLGPTGEPIPSQKPGNCVCAPAPMGTPACWCLRSI